MPLTRAGAARDAHSILQRALTWWSACRVFAVPALRHSTSIRATAQRARTLYSAECMPIVRRLKKRAAQRRYLGLSILEGERATAARLRSRSSR